VGANGFITVLALLVAGYSLLSDIKRLDFKLRVSKFDYLMAIGLIGAILIVIYSPVILSFKVIEPIGWYWGFDEETMSFSCLTILILLFIYKVLGNKIPTSNFELWACSSERLLREKKFTELGFLLEKYHNQVFEIIDTEVWYVKAHNALHPPRAIFSPKFISKKNVYHPFMDYFCLQLTKLFPANCKKQDVVEVSLSRILKSKSFVIFLAETYPLIAADASLLRFSDDDEYIRNLFEALISKPSSPLYRELRDNQNCSYTGEYVLDESNPLLNFYLKDISIASNLNIYKPIGDYVVEYIKSHKGKDDFYNQPNDRFSEGEKRWDCPIFIGTCFFEVMISQAIFQRYKDHMWLMYCDSFIGEIINSIDPSSEVDMDREFPSRYDYLIYNLFSACDRWVGAVEYVINQPKPFKDAQQYPEYWAAKTLGSMLRKIIKSDKMNDHQKDYFLDIVLRRMKDLDHKDLQVYSKLIIDNCIRPAEYSAVDHDVIAILHKLYRNTDHVLKSHTSTFEVEMGKY
jgi:hypothetical protein